MAWSLVQHTEVTSGTSVQYASNVTTGNLLVLNVGSGGSVTWSSVSDGGDMIVSLGNFHAPTLNDSMQAWACVTALGGTRPTWSFTPAVGEAGWIAEFSGAPASCVQSGTLQGADFSATTPYTLAVPTFGSSLGDLVIQSHFTEGTTSGWNSPWNQIVIDSNGNGWAYTTGTGATVTPSANITGVGAARDISISFGIQGPSAAAAPFGRPSLPFTAPQGRTF